MILFFENQRQIDDFYELYEKQNKDRVYTQKIRGKSGLFHYMVCLFYLFMGHEIAIVYPRQKMIAYLAVKIKKVFFIEDGINALGIKKSFRELLISRWFGPRLKALYHGYQYNALELAYFRKLFGFEKISNTLSAETKTIVVILNNQEIEEVKVVISGLDDIISAENKLRVFTHPANNKTQTKNELISFFSNEFNVNTRDITFPVKEDLCHSVECSSLTIAFKSAVLLDFWLTCSSHQQERLKSKIHGLL